jgi:hypothetical protein
VKSIRHEALGVKEFLAKVEAAIEGREIAKIVSFKGSPSEIVVIFSKLGTTEIKYEVKPDGQGFAATLKSEKIALAHRPFKADIESKLMGVMERIGARVEG